ncbi:MULTISPECIES: phosphoribosylformylglycinamidine synthase subunit PurS [Aquirufa]|uniref:Phosphoribosylformylglycinamidine synthase subunit PurS n=2 Tax=Aquirufa TaxID=2676247 RepID=A0ABT4JG12_9BACT|nr:phosphoribosylformylglycinamidine synthase subunit PurS [Aquirufa ecclesiirivi]MCZ2472941.1 phosphoribosylformylglycinamidine synthase subunit PurS [Aquirufa ecclesiirivi]MCZ2474491.1 phosphoribosylformylglycinamidine synthase subunit PurS [Aquirufa ecclesiirivi]MDF0694599.1 phosphoribosylformylglycinamidine synthase subunit PurS [Aquirufa ecclesiirivi]NHC50069.1 phosphoribosylformylglycinamidine synthase subunit PurS [Aquirufa ecclesiirivi]
MKFLAEINVMPQKEILDPQGKAVRIGLQNLDIHQVADVRIGKHIQLQIEASSEAEANEIVTNACKKLLANLIMEEFDFVLKAI